jgi:hypothetical protein
MPIEQFVYVGKKFSEAFTADQQATLREAFRPVSATTASPAPASRSRCLG